ncbi:DUF2867 domain-containing protein [Streptomyces sp. NPDC003635]
MTAIRNIHERVIEAPATAVGALLDRLSAADDPLFPAPAWKPMLFDRPLAVGATGGHGPVRYGVSAYEPGRRVRFDFSPPGNGFHEISVEPLGDDRCRIRHVLEQDMRGADLLAWVLAVKVLHGVIVEELFDNAERATAGSVDRPVRWSPFVRLYNRLTWPRARAAAAPEGAGLIRTAVEQPAYTDTYAIELLPGMPRDPGAWAGVLGFPELTRTEDELLQKVLAGGLTARASIHVGAREVTLNTAVRADSPGARLYWGLARPFHPFMARRALRREHRRLALAVPPAGERARNGHPVSMGERAAGLRT